MKERITHAAVLSKDGKTMKVGKQHADCFRAFENIDDASEKAKAQGFFTSLGRYVDRTEAAKIAAAARQVPKGTDFLFSEDLWSERHGGKFNYDPKKGYVKK